MRLFTNVGRTGAQHALPGQFRQYSHGDLATGACEIKYHKVSRIRVELCGGEEANRKGYKVRVLSWSVSAQRRTFR